MTLMANNKVVKKIWEREATMIALLRRYAYGKFTISKRDGRIEHLEAAQSILIKDGEDILDDLE